MSIGTALYVGEWYQLEFFLPVMDEEKGEQAANSETIAPGKEVDQAGANEGGDVAAH